MKLCVAIGRARSEYIYRQENKMVKNSVKKYILPSLILVQKLREINKYSFIFKYFTKLN